MSSRENLEITNPSSLFHQHHHHQTAMMPAAKQRSKRKLHKRRVIVSIFLLLPALAAIIGIVAWAISVEVAKSNEISGFSAGTSNHHRKQQQQQQQQQPSFQLFKRNRPASSEISEQPVAAAVVASSSDRQVNQVSSSSSSSNKEQQVIKQQVTSSSRRRVLVAGQQQQAIKSGAENEQASSSTLLLTNIEQVGALTSGLAGREKQPAVEATGEEVETTTGNPDEQAFFGVVNKQSANNDPIKQHKQEFKQKQNPLDPNPKEDESVDNEQQTSGRQRSSKSKLDSVLRRPSGSFTNDNDKQNASKEVDSPQSNWKEEYTLKQNQALAKKQRFIKLDGKLNSPSLVGRRVEGAQYTIIINNNKQAPVASEISKESSDEQASDGISVNNNNNNNNNNSKEKLSEGNEQQDEKDEKQMQGGLEKSGEDSVVPENGSGGKLDEEGGDQRQDELNFEAIASAISSSLNSQVEPIQRSASSSSPAADPLEGDTGSLEEGSAEPSYKQAGELESSVESLSLDEQQVGRLPRRRSTGQNVAEVIDHIVEHRKSQQGLSQNLKGPQIVVVAPVMGSMMKARSLTRSSPQEDPAAMKKTSSRREQLEVSEDKRISSSMKKEALSGAMQEHKWLGKPQRQQQQQQVAPSASIESSLSSLPAAPTKDAIGIRAKLAKRLRSKPLGARLLGVSPTPPGSNVIGEATDNAHNSGKRQVKKLSEEGGEEAANGIKFSERVQVIEDDDSSALLAGTLSSGSSSSSSMDANKKESSRSIPIPIQIPTPEAVPLAGNLVLLSALPAASAAELVPVPGEAHQHKRLWMHERDQDTDESGSSGSAKVASNEQLTPEDRSNIHVASQAGQARLRSPRHEARFDLERYQPSAEHPPPPPPPPPQSQQSATQTLQVKQMQPQPLRQQQQQQQQPARLYSAEQLIREHMLKAMSKAADRANSSAALPGGATGVTGESASRFADEASVKQQQQQPLGPPEPISEQVQAADDSSGLHPAYDSRPGLAESGAEQPVSEQQRDTNKPPASQEQEKSALYQRGADAAAPQMNRYNQEQQVSQLPVFADQEYNVPAHLAESVIHDLERAAPVSMFESQQQQQLAKGQVPHTISRYYQQQFSSLPSHLQRQIISHQQQQLVAAMQAAASQQHPFFLAPALPANKWAQQQVSSSSSHHVRQQAWPAIAHQIGRSSDSAASGAVALLEAAKGTSKSNPTMALRHLFSSMRHRSGAVAPVLSSPVSSPSLSANAAYHTPQRPPFTSPITRSAKEELMSAGSSSPHLVQQQAKLISGAGTPTTSALTRDSASINLQDQEAQDSYGQMPVYHMMPQPDHYAHGPAHYGGGGGGGQHYEEDDKKSKGITFHFGGGPIGGGTQLITSPMGIFKHLMIPLLPNPRVNLNGKVVFGVVLEKSTAFGEPKKKYKFWG